MKVSAKYAVEHFDDLAAAVDSGEVVEISRLHKPALKLIRSNVVQAPKTANKRVLGAGKAFIELPGVEALEAIDRAWKREIEAKVIG